MTETPAPDGEALAKFFAKQVLQGFPGSKTVKQGAVDEVELANRIGEIEIETQIAGASYLKAHIIDPEWALTISGWLKVKEGLLQPIEVEFPEGSKWFWILCAVEGSTNVTEPNLTVTFEDRIVYFLRQYYGKKYAPPGIQTRAQFIRSLVREVGQHGEEKAGFICPSLNVVQPVETEGEEESKKTKTDEARQESEEKVAKRGGLGAGSFTIEGSPATRQQALDVSTAIQTAQRLKAPPAAVEALIAAGIAESGFRREVTESNKPQTNPQSVPEGVWQSDKIPGNEVGRQAEHFLIGGESFAEGGAIERANKGIKPAQIGVEVEIGGTEAANQRALPEARTIIAQAGGAKPAVEESTSDVSQLQRGTSANPDEDSFECAVRLATQVDWFFFSDNHNFYYMDGPTFMRQKPALYVDIPRNHVKTPRGESSYGGVLSPSTFTFDNTTYEYRISHKLKTRVQRKSKAVKPASPAEVKLLLECGVDEFHAGEVFKFENSGPIDGVWIITNTRRECLLNTYTEIILEPPIEPLPEPRGESEVTSTTGKAPANKGTVGAVAEQAEKAYSEKEKYKYSEEIPARENKGTLFGTAPRTMDCASFATLCYKEAGMPDPNGHNYSPIGNTSMIQNMVRTGNPTPGDLIFYGPNEAYPNHVVVYIGNGNAIGCEAPENPVLEGAAWGSESLGGGAGPVIGGERAGWRLKSSTLPLRLLETEEGARQREEEFTKKEKEDK